MMRWTVLAALLVLLGATVLGGGAALAERSALLVGGDDYRPEVRALAPALDGPGGAVALLASALRADLGAAGRSVALTDRPGLLDAGEGVTVGKPTRAGILAAFGDLLAASRPGDEVLVYLAGRGARIPAPGATEAEPDGEDKIFLPGDFELSRRGDRIELANTLSDDTIGAFTSALVRRGAVVWLIIDACHSGAMLRGAGAGFAQGYPGVATWLDGAGAAIAPLMTVRSAEAGR